MARLLIVLMIVVLGVSGDGKTINKRDIMVTTDWNQFVSWLCEYDSSLASNWGIICSTSATSTTTSATVPTSSTSRSPASSSTTANKNVGAASPTTQGRPQWCQFSNGTSIPYGYTFMHSECTLCQCAQSHAITCTTLQCMPTYCIDGSTPILRPGQCCPQCAYENTSAACVINGVGFPTGTLLRRTSDNVQCWCQLGGIECRKASASLFSGLDYFGDGTAVYVIVIIVIAVILFGTLLCCGSTLFFYYYYYKRQQQQAGQGMTEYYMNAGWQPMADDGQVVDEAAEQKQAEAEQAQYEYENTANHSEEYVPPPYAHYNGSYVNEQTEKDATRM